jgi:hypothetical protein
MGRRARRQKGYERWGRPLEAVCGHAKRSLCAVGVSTVTLELEWKEG